MSDFTITNKSQFVQNFENLRNNHDGGSEAFDALVETEFASEGIDTDHYTDADKFYLMQIATLDGEEEGLSDGDIRLYNLANTDNVFGLTDTEITEFQARLTDLGLENIENLSNEQINNIRKIAKLDGKAGDLSEKDIRLYNLANTDGQFGLTNEETNEFEEILSVANLGYIKVLSNDEITELEDIALLDNKAGLSDYDMLFNRHQLGVALSSRAEHLYKLANTDNSKILSDKEVEDFQARLMTLGFGKIEDLTDEQIKQLQNIAKLDGEEEGLSDEDVEMHLAARKFYEMWGPILSPMATSESEVSSPTSHARHDEAIE